MFAFSWALKVTSSLCEPKDRFELAFEFDFETESGRKLWDDPEFKFMFMSEFEFVFPVRVLTVQILSEGPEF